jgi:hypothetical protein
MAVLNNRLNMSVDFYNNQSNNLLLKSTIPTSTGYSNQFQNFGSVQNRGVEILVNSTNINTKDFKWTTGFNISFNRSKVLALYGNGVGGNVLYDDNFIVQVGQRLGQFYGYKYDGVYTTDDFIQNANGTYALKDGVTRLKGGNVANVKPGDIKFASTTGEMDAKSNPVFSTNDRVAMGNGEPNYTGGITNSFTYKGFDLSVFMNFTGGNKVFNANARRFYGPYLPNENTFTAMANRFRLIDPVTGKETTDLARLAELNPNQYSKKQLWSLHADNSKSISDPAIDYFLEDGSFLRLNTITLGYSLPHDLLKKAGIYNARFYATLNNIHTFTKYSGYDPEVNNSGSPTKKGGYDDSAYPRAKSIVVGLNLTF